jgi:hypothetical protein
MSQLEEISVQFKDGHTRQFIPMDSSRPNYDKELEEITVQFKDGHTRQFIPAKVEYHSIIADLIHDLKITKLDDNEATNAYDLYKQLTHNKAPTTVEDARKICLRILKNICLLRVGHAKEKLEKLEEELNRVNYVLYYK